MRQKPPYKAVALHYDQVAPPRVVAAGTGDTARLIAETARKLGTPLMADPNLVEALSALELDDTIPEELFVAAAVVLAWAYWLQGKEPPRRDQGRTDDR
jgi:flagellar biosynthesis protein